MNGKHFVLDDAALALRCGTGAEEILDALGGHYTTVFETEEPAGAATPYHVHTEDEAVIVTGGRMRFNVEEELVLLKPGEMITIRAGAIHASASVGRETARMFIAMSGALRDVEKARS